MYGHFQVSFESRPFSVFSLAPTPGTYAVRKHPILVGDVY